MSRRAHGHNAVSGGCLALILVGSLLALCLGLAVWNLSDVFQRVG